VGQPFPSVRTIASDLKIHPNTVHKVIQLLIEERWLEVRPGIGTAVASRPKARSVDGRRLLRSDVDRLVAKAQRIDVGLQDVMDELTKQWSKLEHSQED